MRSLFRATVDMTRGVLEPLMQRRKVPAPTPPPVRPKGKEESYSAVAVRPCADACQAALALAHQRILKSEAPEDLPLPDCTNVKCRCRLEEFHDRRASGERRMRDGDEEESTNGGDRRLPGDRRVNKQRSQPTSYFNDY